MSLVGENSQLLTILKIGSIHDNKCCHNTVTGTSSAHDRHFSTGYVYMYDKYVQINNLQALPQVKVDRVSSLNSL